MTQDKVLNGLLLTLAIYIIPFVLLIAVVTYMVPLLGCMLIFASIVSFLMMWDF